MQNLLWECCVFNCSAGTTGTWSLCCPPNHWFMTQDLKNVWQRVQVAAAVYDSPEGRALSPSRNRSSSPLKEHKAAGTDWQAKSSKALVPFPVVIEVRIGHCRAANCYLLFAIWSFTLHQTCPAADHSAAFTNGQFQQQSFYTNCTNETLSAHSM